MKNSRILSLLISVAMIGASSCDYLQTPRSSLARWDIPTVPFEVDSCFAPQRVPVGFLVIPPTEGVEIDQIAFDPLDEDELYVTTRERTVQLWKDATIYRVNLRDHTSTVEGILEGSGRSVMRLNNRPELIVAGM